MPNLIDLPSELLQPILHLHIAYLLEPENIEFVHWARTRPSSPSCVLTEIGRLSYSNTCLWKSESGMPLSALGLKYEIWALLNQSRMVWNGGWLGRDGDGDGWCV